MGLLNGWTVTMIVVLAGLLIGQIVQISHLRGSVGYKYFAFQDLLVLPTAMVYWNVDLGVPALVWPTAVEQAFPYPIETDCNTLYWEYGKYCLPATQNPTQQLHVFRTYGENHIYALQATGAPALDPTCGDYSWACSTIPNLKNDVCAVMFNTTASVLVQIPGAGAYCTASADQTVLYAKRIGCSQIMMAPVSLRCGVQMCVNVSGYTMAIEPGGTGSMYYTSLADQRYCTITCTGQAVLEQAGLSCDVSCIAYGSTDAYAYTNRTVTGSFSVIQIDANVKLPVSTAISYTGCAANPPPVETPMYVCVWYDLYGVLSTTVESVNITNNGGALFEPGLHSPVDGTHPLALTLGNGTGITIEVIVALTNWRSIKLNLYNYQEEDSPIVATDIFQSQPSGLGLQWLIAATCPTSQYTPPVVISPPRSIYVGIGSVPCANKYTISDFGISFYGGGAPTDILTSENSNIALFYIQSNMTILYFTTYSILISFGVSDINQIPDYSVCVELTGSALYVGTLLPPGSGTFGAVAVTSEYVPLPNAYPSLVLGQTAIGDQAYHTTAGDTSTNGCVQSIVHPDLYAYTFLVPTLSGCPVPGACGGAAPAPTPDRWTGVTFQAYPSTIVGIDCADIFNATNGQVFNTMYFLASPAGSTSYETTTYCGNLNPGAPDDGYFMPWAANFTFSVNGDLVIDILTVVGGSVSILFNIGFYCTNINIPIYTCIDTTVLGTWLGLSQGYQATIQSFAPCILTGGSTRGDEQAVINRIVASTNSGVCALDHPYFVTTSCSSKELPIDINIAAGAQYDNSNGFTSGTTMLTVPIYPSMRAYCCQTPSFDVSTCVAVGTTLEEACSVL